MAFEGIQLGRYQVCQMLGRGGMGEVYLAEDSRIRRHVAIKVVRSELTTYPDLEKAGRSARLFEHEMKIISQLDHPHILPLYDYGEVEVDEKTITYMVMPYRPEGSLSTWLRQRKSAEPLAAGHVATFISQAADALHHAHKCQVVHQDVKPSNFLIRVRPEKPEQPDLLLTDFGISRFTTVSQSSQAIQGTPTYMAPEQWEGHPTYASDQYALAVMAYELLVGRAPFEGRLESIMFKHVNIVPPSASSLMSALPSAFDEVLLRALAKKPEERFASIADFASAFQAVCDAELPTIIRARPSDIIGLDTLPASSIAPAEANEGNIHTKLKTSMREAEHGAEWMPEEVAVSEQTAEAVYEAPTRLSTPFFMPPGNVYQSVAFNEPPGGDQNEFGQFALASSQELERWSPAPVHPVAGVITRPTVFGRSSFSARTVLIVLALVLIVAGGVFYNFVIVPSGATRNAFSLPDSLTAWEPAQSHATPQANHSTPTAQANTNIPVASKPQTGNSPSPQAQINVQATDQANTKATAQAVASAQASANANATAVAQKDAKATAAVVTLTTPLYRLYSAAQGDHFYTTSASERDTAIARDGYVSESVTGYILSAQVAGSMPLYRLYSATQGDHFYTTSASERDTAAASDGYKYEGVAGYVFGSQVNSSMPLYRLYSATHGDHFYTMSASERDAAIARDGYKYEGVVCYIFTG